jgi:hypothetical protein
MNVSQEARKGTRVRLPPDVVRPFEVYVNGVPQTEGIDFRVEGRTLVFARELKTEGKLGLLRWLSIAAGVAGTYRQNDSVDVVYERNGQRVVATKLPLEPLGGT